MTKLEFADQLRSRLSSLPRECVEGYVEYYGEMIEDRIESGMTEAEAVEALGTPDSVVKGILEGVSPTEEKAKLSNGKRRMRWWEITLLVLGSPLWGAIVLTAFALILTAVALVWTAVAVIWSLWGALAAVAVGCGTVFAVTLTASPMGALIYLGIALFSAGVAVGTLLLCVKLTVLLAKLSVKPIVGLKNRKNRKVGHWT